MVEGLIADDHMLPSAAIDVIWRVTNHVATLTPQWFASYVPDLLSPGHYVGLVAQATLVDRFADGLGVNRVTLAYPEPGEPTGERPEGAETSNVRKALSLVAAEREMQFELIDSHYVIDAVGVSAMFHMMNRVANATGTPLDVSTRRSKIVVNVTFGGSEFVSRADTP